MYIFPGTRPLKESSLLPCNDTTPNFKIGPEGKMIIYDEDDIDDVMDHDEEGKGIVKNKSRISF